MDCVKQAGGDAAERCSPSKNNTSAALGKAAAVRFEDTPVCVWNLEKAVEGGLHIMESLSGTFQEMMCFGRCESLGLLFVVNL